MTRGIDTEPVPVFVVCNHELFSAAKIFQMDFDLHLIALQFKAGGVERWGAKEEVGIVGGSDALFRDAETVLVQLTAATLVMDDRDRIDAIRNFQEDIEIRLPYLVQTAHSAGLLDLSRKPLFGIKQCDAEIAVAIPGVEHFDHDTARATGRRFG
jgi:hypothetical protein